jgi:hypothetical protein
MSGERSLVMSPINIAAVKLLDQMRADVILAKGFHKLLGFIGV